MSTARIVEWQFLHVSDCPLSIDVLLALRDGRDWRPIGLRPEPNGLNICWELLLDSYLSSTEKATVRLVQAAARIEGHGGLPHRVQGPVTALVDDLSGRSQARRREPEVGL